MFCGVGGGGGVAAEKGRRQIIEELHFGLKAEVFG